MAVVVNPVVVLLYDANGIPLAVQDGVAIPATTSAILVAGSDGTDAHYMRTAADGTVRVDPTGTTAQPVSGTVTANQGAAAALASKWPVQVTDGTNVMPTADAAARAIYSFVTDGTHTMPTLDVAARAGFIKITDGTNLFPTADVAARALFAKITDGTNVLPTMDVAGRSGFQRITDGTNTAAVKAASTAPAATDPALVVAISPNTPTLPVSVASLPLPAGAATAANQTTLGNQTTKINDGTNTMAVKAASTAAVATDPSAVVALSPNSPLPAGTNTIGAVTGPGAAGAAVSGKPVRIGASDGTNTQDVASDANGILYASTLEQAIARARVANALVGNLTGDVSTNATTHVGIQFTTYTDQTANAQRSVTSASANDTSAGTGARTIKLTYYSISGTTVTGPFTETVTLNGTTAVNTVSTTIAFVEKIEVLTAGSGGTSAGIITLFASTAGGGGAITTLTAGTSTSRWAHHWVASGRTFMLYDVFIHNGASSGNFPKITIEVLDLATTNAIERVMETFRLDGRSNIAWSAGHPISVAGPARVRAYVTPDNTPIQLTTFNARYVEI